jgi:hypothetical protein
MSYKKTNDAKDKWRSSPNDGYDIYDTLNENFARTLNELSKFHPYYLQSISDLQLDYIQTAKNIIENSISTQRHMNINNKNITDSSNWIISPLSIPISYIDQFTRQVSDFINNTIRVSDLTNQITLNILHTARQNLDIYNRATDAASKYSNDVAKAWDMFFSITEQK